MYVLAAFPDLADQPAEVVLEWRDRLTDSLLAYRSRVSELASVSTSVDEDDVSDVLRVVGPQLDRDFAELIAATRAAKIGPLLRDRKAGYVGLGGGIAITLVSAGHPLLALGALVQGTATQAMTLATDLYTKQKALRSHPLYWRYAMRK